MKMNPVVHFEMPAEDNIRVKKFYEEAFGWNMTQLGSDMEDYLLANTSPLDKNNMHINSETIDGGFFKKGESGTVPRVVVSVDNIVEHIDIVTKAGGKIMGKVVTIPDIGEFVIFEDTEGNQVGMLQPIKM